MLGLSEKASSSLLIVLMLAFGSYNTINTKLQSSICSPTRRSQADIPAGTNCPAGEMYFVKPWLQNICMFIGEAALIVVYITTNSKGKIRRAQQRQDALVNPPPEGTVMEATPLYVFAIPAACDVFGTGLAQVSLAKLDAAIWQMLRSSIIIFSAIVSVVFLKRKLQPFHYVATIIVFIGLCCVGVSTALDSEGGSAGGSASDQMTGIILVVGAQVFSAFQMCFEELLLTGRAPTSAKKVVGMEGVWGTTYMIVILILMYFIHGGDNGHVEDTPEGLRLLTGNGFLAFLVVSYMMSISVYNLVGITVGKKMSAVVRCLVDSCRTVVVWVVNLMLHYLVDEKLGSAWQPHTWLQLVGFVILVFGTLLYNEVLTPPRWLTSGTPGEAGERTFSTTSVDNVMRKIDLSAEGMADPGDPIRASGISLDWPQAREGPRPAAQVN